MKGKPEKWVAKMDNMKLLAEGYPQQAYFLFTKSTQHKWGYALRGRTQGGRHGPSGRQYKNGTDPRSGRSHPNRSRQEPVLSSPEKGDLRIPVPTKNMGLPFDALRTASTNLPEVLLEKEAFNRPTKEEWATKARMQLKSSVWLSATPLTPDGHELNATEFRDALQ
eukprot:GHVN01032661.1.p1 GENE.GHVN01032661.1~~GHVN01032661.1.p1  ORF type:complete len:166 (-),score=19.80 GHVN01032661.1:904-1401(-)